MLCYALNFTRYCRTTGVFLSVVGSFFGYKRPLPLLCYVTCYVVLDIVGQKVLVGRRGFAVPHSVRGFSTFKVGNTQFRGLCLSPLSRALGQLSKYEIKKGGHLFEAVLLRILSVHPKKGPS